MDIDILIDEFTDCLIERKTGSRWNQSTSYVQRQLSRKTIRGGNSIGVGRRKTVTIFMNCF